MSADVRLVPPAVFGAVAVGILIGFPALLNTAASVAWVITGALIVRAVIVQRWRSVVATAALTAAVAAVLLSSATFGASARNPELIVDAAQANRFVTLVAVMDADGTTGASSLNSTASDSSRSRASITITEVTVGKTTLSNLAIPAILFGSLPSSGIGTKISVSGTIANTEAGDHTAYLVFARGSAQLVQKPPWYLHWSNGLRADFRAAAAQLPGDGGALLPGLAVGDTSAVNRTLDTAMKSTSLSHLTAVSGANCAVVVGLVMLLGSALGASRRLRIVMALIVLVGFVVLVTPDASVLRAAVMAALVMFLLASGRPTRGLPVLCLAVILLLFIDPWMSRDFGFILSVLATAGLLVLAGPLARVLSRWLPAPLAALISIPLAAQLACQPVLILLNPTIPVYGVIANLLAEPAAPVATVLGLLACVSLALFPAVGEIALSIAWLPSAWIAAIAHFFAAAPGAQAPWISGALGAVAIAATTVLILVVVLKRRSPATRIIAAALLLGVVSYGGGILGQVLGRSSSLPPLWQVAACDVGQGDAVLVRSVDYIALIDTGPDPKVLTTCLQDLGIHHIDLLVLSHFDLDHVGGTPAVLGIVDHALVGPISDASDTALRDSLQRSGATVSEVARGERGVLGELTWEVLWPPARLGSVEPGNAASVTLRFEGAGSCSERCLSSLFLGDLGEEAQSRMFGVAHPAPVDVVKVAHHGSADQSQRLYERVSARVGVVSVGESNTYGHPTQRLLDMLTEVNTTIVRTDLEGMILVSPAPNGGISVWTEHSPAHDVGTH
ncbi:MAG: ComEC/Rec2 family competence protein [Terrimesophilobacter sp.]